MESSKNGATGADSIQRFRRSTPSLLGGEPHSEGPRRAGDREVGVMKNVGYKMGILKTFPKKADSLQRFCGSPPSLPMEGSQMVSIGGNPVDAMNEALKRVDAGNDSGCREFYAILFQAFW